jgi:uncharacterized membrane protein YoaK (UPF0700 family)
MDALAFFNLGEVFLSAMTGNTQRRQAILFRAFRFSRVRRSAFGRRA